MPKPTQGTFPAPFENYVNQVKEDNLQEAFKKQQDIIDNFFYSIPEEKTNSGYAEGKWTLKELLQHMIDTERIFNYRALSFARKESASLPGFEENDYAANSNAACRSWKDLCDEMKALRISTNFLYKSFSAEMLNNAGLANNKPATVLAMGFITVGHITHHKKIIEERYL